jgi:hypothetical protein
MEKMVANLCGRQYFTWFKVEKMNTPASSHAPDLIRIVS